MIITKQYIEQNLLTVEGKLNANKTRHLKESSEELYLIFYDVSKPLCEVCSNTSKFINFAKGYNSVCSKECSNKSPSRIAKIQANKPSDIGSRISKGLKKRSKEDIESATQKGKATRLDLYGDENYTNTDKNKRTCLDKYGVEYISQTASFKDKSKATKLEKYNDKNYNNAKKIKLTREAKKKDGIQYTVFPNSNQELLTKEYIENNFIDNDKLLKDKFMSFYNCKETFMYKTLRDFDVKYKRSKSYAESEIIVLVPFSKQNDRKIIKPLELDVYSKEHNFAIEYNGMASHSFGYHKYSIFNNTSEKSDYHLGKTLLCEEKGIQLFHIFENEWLDETKKDIWISKILGKQGLHKRIFARKTSIKEVQTKEARLFLEQNHLQCYSNSSIKIGLYYEDELVCIGTFGKPRFSKKYEYELIRMASKKNITITGGASKILKYFERVYKPKSLVSYANRRWSQRNVYLQTGFTFSHSSTPNYFYFKEGSLDLESRNKYQKRKLEKLLDTFNPELTETDNMYLNGYRKIYDCGNHIYFKTY